MTSALAPRWTLRFAAAWVFVVPLAAAHAQGPRGVGFPAQERDAVRATALTVPPIVSPSPTAEPDWMTYLGGSLVDYGYRIAVDGAGNAWVTGTTNSTDFEARNNAYHGGGEYGGDAYVAKVNPSGEVEWMTYLGGSDDDYGYGIAVDSAGNVLVAGFTESTDFEGRNNANHGIYDAFVAKVTPSGVLQWMTYIGGSGLDYVSGVAVDGADNVWVMGSTTSTDFEGRNNAFHGNRDAFIAKVSPSGVLQWMTYLGGSNYDQGFDIAVDVAGNAWVAGETRSTDFEGRNNGHHGGGKTGGDGFVVKVSPSGALQWMTYLGGSLVDYGFGVAVDGAGNAWVTGTTNSTDFEGRNNAYHGGGEYGGDAYVAKVNPSGEVEWMTYLGGSNNDSGYDIAVDSAGNVLVTGYTGSTDFEGRNNAHHGGGKYGRDGFVVKVSPSGVLEWMTYLGGSDDDSGSDITVDGAGNAWVSGWTGSTDFEGRNNAFHGAVDAFVVKLGLDGGGDCTGRERIAKAKCVNKNGANRLTVKLVKGVPGDEFTVTLSTGDEKDGTINSRGKGKAKFKHLPSGGGTATARWACGAESKKEYGCP